MKKKIPIVRIIVGVIASALIAVGINLFIMATRVDERFEEQSQARPLDLVVDFSQRGTFTAPLTQTWSACHGQTIDLHLVSGADSEPVPSELLASLKLSWKITHADGTVLVEEESWTFLPEQGTREDGVVTLGYFHPFEQGEYTFSCKVLIAEPMLHSVEQRLVCEYHPCGIEKLPATFGRFFGTLAFAFSGVLLVFIGTYTSKS